MAARADFGPTLRKAYAGDAAPRPSSRSRSQALKKQVDEGDLFKSFGSQPAEERIRRRPSSWPRSTRSKKADPNLTDPQAYSKAYTDRSNRADREADEGRRAAN
jgi:hypothetical protein